MKPVFMRGQLVIIFMGVAGAGKTTVGSLFARTTGAVFMQGDEFDPLGQRGEDAPGRAPDGRGPRTLAGGFAGGH